MMTTSSLRRRREHGNTNWRGKGAEEGRTGEGRNQARGLADRVANKWFPPRPPPCLSRLGDEVVFAVSVVLCENVVKQLVLCSFLSLPFFVFLSTEGWCIHSQPSNVDDC